MCTIEKKVEEEHNGKKIRLFLKEDLGISSRMIRSASIEKRILVNKVPVKMDYLLKVNDNVVVNLFKEESQNITPEPMDLDIVYEDDDIIVVNKRPNMIVHPTKNNKSGTLANGLLNYFKETNQKCIVRLVSRLDMDTSGLIIIAKHQFAHMQLSKDMSEDKIEKRYIAVVHGNLEKLEGTIDLPIYRPDGEGAVRRVIDSRGQRSITHYKVVERLKNADIVECILETGRTHQIRVHLKALGHPIYGDTFYGDENDNELINRQALHAYGLNLESPRTKEVLELRATLPSDIENLINLLKV
ncbi:RluA family pseudouridine synthase [Clostridium gasigenes]|uniref:RluA family pseudouridine synthase n=1 Tax=Clostridium gasigenes TaxID=94869 RepID=UPI001C0B0838|nr:RluA family pseudouridine synthase [Clostridium gasigenes]MBU3103780.1 RluA family pseudouridine synthase [Clostridium gasigenes]